MPVLKEKKAELVNKFKINEKDSGSAEVQVALLTERINQLTEHFKTHVKDHHSRRGLMKMINKRKSLLKYLSGNNFESYKKVIQELGIRK